LIRVQLSRNIQVVIAIRILKGIASCLLKGDDVRLTASNYFISLLLCRWNVPVDMPQCHLIFVILLWWWWLLYIYFLHSFMLINVIILINVFVRLLIKQQVVGRLSSLTIASWWFYETNGFLHLTLRNLSSLLLLQPLMLWFFSLSDHEMCLQDIHSYEPCIGVSSKNPYS